MPGRGELHAHYLFQNGFATAAVVAADTDGEIFIPEIDLQASFKEALNISADPELVAARNFAAYDGTLNETGVERLSALTDKRVVGSLIVVANVTGAQDVTLTLEHSATSGSGYVTAPGIATLVFPTGAQNYGSIIIRDTLQYIRLMASVPSGLASNITGAALLSREG